MISFPFYYNESHRRSYYWKIKNCKACKIQSLSFNSFLNQNLFYHGKEKHIIECKRTRKITLWLVFFINFDDKQKNIWENSENVILF